MASPGLGQELVAWAKDNKLTEDIINVLNEEGFTSLNEIRQLSPQDLKDIFLDQKLMRSAQYVRLKKAVEQLNDNPQPRKNTDRRHSHETEDERYTAASCLEDYHERPRDAERTKYTEHPPERSARGAPCTLPETLQSGCSAKQPLDGERPSKVVQPSVGVPCQITERHAANTNFWLPEKTADWSPLTLSTPPDVAISTTSPTYRFLLLGKTGAGKSKTGNTILGEDVFSHDISFTSVTQICELKKTNRNGITIELMDAPGLFDTNMSHEEIATIIMQSVACMHPGPHAIFYVIKLGRYTEEEFGVYQRLKALFDVTVTSYMIVLFTHGDTLEENQKTIESVLAKSPPTLTQVLTECNYRYVVFNNKARDKQPQVEQLLHIVKQVVAQNDNRPYSCPKYCAIGQGLEEEVARRMAEVEKREVESKRYVQELQEKTQIAEETIAKERKEFQAKEEERDRILKMAEERNEQKIENLKETMKQEQLAMEEQHRNEQAEREKLDKEHKMFLADLEKQRQKEKDKIKKMEEKLLELEKNLREEQEKEHEERKSTKEEEIWKEKSRIAEKENSDVFQKLANMAINVLPLLPAVISLFTRRTF